MLKELLRKHKVKIELDNENISRLLTALQEYQSIISSELTKEGLQRAKEAGKILGRPRSEINLKEVVRLTNVGYSCREIAGKLGVSAATISRLQRLIK